MQDFAAMDKYLRQNLGVRLGVALADIHQECANVLSKDELQEICAHLSTGTVTDQKHAATLTSAKQQNDPQRCLNVLSNYFLVDGGDATRGSLMTKALATARPGLHERCQSAQQKFFALSKELKALTLVEASMALYTLAGVVLQRYTEARRVAGALDFDDLILKTKSLLEGKGGEAQWVLYKLDGGLDHILVDEAQDTSPEQWQIIKALAGEFFAGAGSRDGIARTVFAVGDEKQSIYSFQGADPKMFADAGEHFAALARNAGLAWKPIELTMSFRTVSPVLAGVDGVFADTQKTPGLTTGGPPPRHSAMRIGQAGLIEIWPTEKPDDPAEADPWSAAVGHERTLPRQSPRRPYR